MEHRPTPDHRRIVGGEEPHRHNLHAVLFGRNDPLAVGGELRRGQPEHDRNVRAVDVSVEDADAAAAAGEREREIHRHGGLADAALAGADGNDVLHAGQRRTSQLGRRDRADVRGHAHVDRGDARHRAHRRLRLLAHLILHGTRRRRQLDRERDLSIGDREVLDEAERHDVAAKVGIVDDAQRMQNGVAIRRSGHTPYLS